MDPRHESYSQEILNQFIHLINTYVQQHIDEIVSQQALQDDLKTITTCIYGYAHLPVDINQILSNKNLLSIDIVPLPAIEEIIETELAFANVILIIESILAKGDSQSDFYHQARSILSVHQL